MGLEPHPSQFLSVWEVWLGVNGKRKGLGYGV
jgi:hypothetical protein